MGRNVRYILLVVFNAMLLGVAGYAQRRRSGRLQSPLAQRQWAHNELSEADERVRVPVTEETLHRPWERAGNVVHLTQRVNYGRALERINVLVNQEGTREDVLQAVLAAGSDVIGVENATLSLFVEGRWVVTNVSNANYKSLVGRVPAPQAFRLFSEAVKRGPMVPDEEVDRQSGAQADVRTTLAFPVGVGAQARAFLTLQRLRPERPFLPEELDFAQALAASVSVALENTLLSEEQRRIVGE